MEVLITITTITVLTHDTIYYQLVVPLTIKDFKQTTNTTMDFTTKVPA